MTRLHCEGRIERHLTDYYGITKYTHRTKDWKLYLEIPCRSYRNARRIENHIKRMKSRKYIENLKKYPEMIDILIKKYNSFEADD